MRRTKIGFPSCTCLQSLLVTSRQSVTSRSAPSVSSARFQSGVQTLLRTLAFLRGIPWHLRLGVSNPLGECDDIQILVPPPIEEVARRDRASEEKLHMLSGSVIDVPLEHLRSGVDMLSARAGRRQFGTLASSLRAFGASVASSSSASPGDIHV